METERYRFSGLIIISAAFLLFSLAGQPAIAKRPPKPRKPIPHKVFVPRHVNPNGRVVPGHWRVEKRKNFIWVTGHYGPKKVWIPGYWKPVGPAPAGKVWVPGDVSVKGVWVSGYWRLKVKAGHVWVSGHYNKKGTWVKGHWRKR